jgi:quercetin dioxygenase-like cupin family protein
MEDDMAHTRLMRANEGLTVKPGPVETLVFPLTHEETDGSFDYLIGEIGYLGGPPMHFHINEDEVLHLLEGELTFKVGEELVEMVAGDVVFVPKGVPHGYVNKQQTIARGVGIFVPSGLARFMLDFSALPPGRPDPQVMEDLGKKHGLIVVGPPLAVLLGLRT